jgi:putative SOS response-associated peptidase YedK
MCGRYTLTSGDYSGLGDRFGALMTPESVQPRHNVCPTEPVVAIVAGEDGARESRLVRWGLVPSYAKDLKGPLMINARSEALKPVFAKLAAAPKHRCLVVADGFYEWLRAEDPKQPRQPFKFEVDGGAPFAFAGLWCWSRPSGDEWLASATVLTCAPNSVVARLHDRMPAILDGPDAEAAWLAGGDVAELCRPLDADRMTSSPADPAINRAGTDGELTLFST